MSKRAGPTAQVPDEPVIFMKPQSALLPHGGTIILPKNTENIHYEAELAVVIGTGGRHISENAAYDHILGFTCGERRVGPCVAAQRRAVGAGQGLRYLPATRPCRGHGHMRVDDLAVSSRLNGETKQSARTSDMIFAVPRLIAFISRVMTLNPGDVIITGTPAGVGAH